MSKKFKKILAGILGICMLAGSMGAVSAADAGTIRIEGEWYQGTNKDLVTLDGTLDVKVIDAAGVDFSKYLFEYGVCVKEAGFYDITLASNATVIPAAKLLVNGVEQSLTISGGNATATAKLKAGENVLGIQVYKGVSNGTKDVVSFILDYIDLTYSDVQTVIVKKEAEAFDSTTVASNKTKYMSTMTWEAMTNISGNNGIATDSQKDACEFVYTINVPEAGEYKLTAVSQAFSINTYTIEVNGKQYAVNSSTASQTETNASQGSITLQETVLTETIPLQAGDNIVKIIPAMRSYQQDYWIKLDYMTFEYVSTITVDKTETVFQVQDCSDLNEKGMVVASATNANGGSFVGLDGNSGVAEPITFTTNITVPEAGDYKLTFVYGSRTDAYASELKVNINDEKDSDENLVYTTLHGSTDVATGKNCNDLYWGTSSRFGGLDFYEHTWNVNLEEGDCKINVEAYKRKAQGVSDYFAAFDCFKLVKISDLDEANLTLSNNFLSEAEGETAQASVAALDTEGCDISADATITYSSDNENIATVDEDGVVTAHNPGNANITATVEYTGVNTVTKTATQQVTVYGSTGVVILGADLDGSTVAIRISSVGAEKTAALKFYAALYGTENGELTSLKELKVISNDGYIPTLVQVTRPTFASTIGETDAIRVFCWAGEDLVTPCCAAVDVQ